MAKQKQTELRYLLIGAGVTGSYYAARLQRAGVKISILCRSKRQEFIKDNGIVLTEHYSQTRSHLAVHTVLEPEDAYDYVLIFLPAHRWSELLPKLETMHRARAFIFFGNNVGGFGDASRRLGEERVLAGFPAVYGVREQQVVRYADSTKTGKKAFNCLRVGEITEPNNRAIRDLKHSFGRAGIKVQRSTSMQDYLVTRAALMIPPALGLYGVSHKTRRLAADRERLRMVIRGYKELGALLRAAGVRITPLRYLLFLQLPERLLAARVKRFLERPFADIVFAAHTGETRREIAALYKQLKDMAARTQSELPALEELYHSASRKKGRSQ